MHVNEFDNIIYIEDNPTYYRRKLFEGFKNMLFVGFGYILGANPRIIDTIIEWLT